MPKAFDLMDQPGRFAAERGLSLGTPHVRNAFTEHVQHAVDSGLRDQLLLHGRASKP
ncbi:hypothetical protein [Sphingomonas beigongshangi]|uniref:hypothetical protein n=1 Tax=Sphingomonas beigongshangi TaxID=2782540 RepID=UPI00193B5CD7|nr:hypothetical protein [Sphingomonas beigongshangi]